MPPSQKTFHVIEPLDMFLKLEWEWDQLRQYNLLENRREKSYVAMNAAMTAWHLADWFCARMERQHYKKLSIETGRSIDNCKAFRKFILEDRAISMCERIAVASKHYQITEADHHVKTVPRVFANMTMGLEPMNYLMVEDHNSMMPIESVIGFALAFWRAVFEMTGLATAPEVAYPAPGGNAALPPAREFHTVNEIHSEIKRCLQLAQCEPFEVPPPTLIAGRTAHEGGANWKLLPDDLPKAQKAALMRAVLTVQTKWDLRLGAG